MENNNELNRILLREMFNKVRKFEIKNIKTQKYDDKHMVSEIEKYVLGKIQKEIKDEDKEY